MKKRRRSGDGYGRDDGRIDHPSLDGRFDDSGDDDTRPAGTTTTTTAVGGMSRASRRRAKKRRGGREGVGGALEDDDEATSAADGWTGGGRDASGGGGDGRVGGEARGAEKKEKTRPTLSGGEDGEDGLMRAIQKFRSSVGMTEVKKKKRMKKEEKGEEENDGKMARKTKGGGKVSLSRLGGGVGGDEREVTSNSGRDGGCSTEPPAGSSNDGGRGGGGAKTNTTSTSSAKGGDGVGGNASNAPDGGADDDDDVESNNDMDPDMEALLSTLTPLQILLFDRKKTQDTSDGGGDDDGVSDNRSSMIDGDDDGGKSVAEAETALTLGIANIDPLLLIPDVTAQHRARILLSSLLAPSGVSAYEFYDRYWGKRPLLASLDIDHEAENAATENRGGGINGKVHNGKRDVKEDGRSRIHDRQYREHETRLDGFLDRSIIDKMMRRNKLRYGLDLNVTRFTDTLGNGSRHRITLDPPPKKRRKKSEVDSRGGSKTAVDDDGDMEYVVANPTDVWSNVDTSSCTLRLLRPHEHNDRIHAMLSLLESEFGCMVGSNAYLTPLHSQGFAPHYDDVDVFILQLEGYKRWRVYAPMNKRETLPRISSRDYTEKEMEDEELLMDVILGPGDVLYLPRGWIHQAETVSRPSSSSSKIKGDRHSLHLTISAMQNWCWADFLDLLMPEALESVASSDKTTSLREGLPRNFLSYMGTMHHNYDDGINDDVSTLPEGLMQAAKAHQARDLAESYPDDESIVDEEEAMIKKRAKLRRARHQRLFKEEAKKRIMRVCKQAMSMLDDACDEIGKRFLSDRLPPALLEPEKSLTKEGISDGDSMAATRHHQDASIKVWPNTLCRLVRPDIARLVVEEGKAVLYHCLDNSRVYHGTPLSPMEFEIDDAPALEQLLTTVEPHWIMVKDLIHGDVEDKMEIAQTL
ncbi:hypothetical protein ACHAW5_003498 [Stephanodiscus triporus]|uniref:Bifunctional lysine-specific demethylase and histidyl-hydroxylase n=1 Tax=Stephanodiscus triporus TaxID=2934178 RepID=A0ABD3NI63_9STRA